MVTNGATTDPAAAPGLVLWGPSPHLHVPGVPSPSATTVGVATTVEMWPIDDLPEPPSRCLLRRRDGSFVAISGVAVAPPTSTRQIREQDFLRIVGRDAVASGRRCDIDGVLLTEGTATRTRVVLRVRPDGGGVEFVPDLAGGETSRLVSVDEGGGRFSLMPDDGTIRWLGAGGDFTATAADRELFSRAFRLADLGIPGSPVAMGRGVGPLEPGEVVLHTLPALRGTGWVITEDVADVHGSLVGATVGGTGPVTIASVRPGPHTALRCFAAANFTGTSFDVSEATELTAAQWAAVQSIRVLRVARPASHPMHVAVELGEDHRLAPDGTRQQYEAYRTTLTLPANVSLVDVRATTTVTVEIGAARYDIGPDQPAVVEVNRVRTLVVTVEATALGTAGLSFRTDTMHPDESFPVFPDRAVHERLAALRDGTADQALSDTAAVNADAQRALGHAMAAIAYADVETVIGTAHGRTISAGAMDHPGWQLAVPQAGKRSTPAFAHLDDAALAAAIAGATDGDDPSRSVGALWGDFVNGAHELAAIIVHKVTDDVHAAGHALHTVLQYVEDGVAKAVSFALHTAERAIDLAHLIVARIGADIHKVISAVQAAFDWPSIVHTQQVLADAFDHALDLLPARINQLAHVVDGVFAGFRDRFVTAIDAKIAEYHLAGSDAVSLLQAAPKDDHASARQTAREKTGWLLAKVADHHAHGDAAVAPSSAVPTSLLALVRSITDHIVDDPAIASALDGLSSYMKAAFAHPGDAPAMLMAGLLEAVKAVVVAALGALDGISLALLTAVEDAIAGFRAALTAPLDVPLVADLYRWAVATHGTTRPTDTFNILNLAALLGALPTTVMSRLVSGVSPFAPATTTRDEGTPAGEPTPEPGREPDPDYALKRDWGVAAGSFGLVGSLLKAALDIQVVAAPTGLGVNTEYGAGENVTVRGHRFPLAPGLDLRRAPTRLSTGLELASLTIDLLGHMASWPGGVPFQPFDIDPHQFIANPADYLDSVGWTYDACTYSVDVVAMLAAGARAGRVAGADNPVEAFLTVYGALTATLLSSVSLGFAIMTAIAEAGTKGHDYLTEVLPLKTLQAVTSTVPGLASVLRAPPVVGDTLGGSLVTLAGADLLFGTASSGLTILMAEKGLIDPSNIE